MKAQVGGIPSKVFIDTSAFYAVLDRDDQNHPAARKAWGELLDSDVELVTTNYVTVETCALLQNRIGLDAVRTFSSDVLALIDVHFITREQHTSAIFSVITANRRKLSLVDCASFVVMREGGLRRAFAFDQHFTEQDFTLDN